MCLSAMQLAYYVGEVKAKSHHSVNLRQARFSRITGRSHRCLSRSKVEQFKLLALFVSHFIFCLIRTCESP